MTDKFSHDDFVRLPKDHLVRPHADWLLGAGVLRRATDAMSGVMIGTGIWYCRRRDYPQPKRFLHEMALSDRSGMSFCWVWPHKVSSHERSGWVATGRTLEVTHE
jgi:hypothetical protein